MAEPTEQAAERRKFWPDVVRSVVIPVAVSVMAAVCTSLATFKIVRPLEAQGKHDEMVDQNRVEARRAVLDSFIRSSHALESATGRLLESETHDEPSAPRWIQLRLDYEGDRQRMRLFFGGLIDRELNATESPLRKLQAYSGLSIDEKRKLDINATYPTLGDLETFNELAVTEAMRSLGLSPDVERHGIAVKVNIPP